MKKKILIVDDERDLVETLIFRLENAGYEVTAAYDGLQGLEKAREIGPDLILLDIMMPKMNGFQVCKELKIDDSTKNIIIIMLTAKAQDGDKFLGKNVGADDYVTKPFDGLVLLEKIKSKLGK